MKKFKRIVAAILLFCMIVTIIPPVPKASAATESTTYKLATGGIQSGKKYLIVYQNGSNVYALNGGGNPGDSTKISINGDSVALSDSSSLEWTFDQMDTNSYAISNNGRYINLPKKSDNFSYQSEPSAINLRATRWNGTAWEDVAAVYMMHDALEYLATLPPEEPQSPQPIDPSLLESTAEVNRQTAQQLFTDVRTWLDPEEGGAE